MEEKFERSSGYYSQFIAHMCIGVVTTKIKLEMSKTRPYSIGVTDP